MRALDLDTFFRPRSVAVLGASDTPNKPTSAMTRKIRAWSEQFGAAFHPVNPNRDICTRNICVLGVGGEAATSYVPAMKAMAAHLDELPLRDVVTHRLPLERAGEAIELSQSDAAMKVVIAPNG